MLFLTIFQPHSFYGRVALLMCNKDFAHVFICIKHRGIARAKSALELSYLVNTSPGNYTGVT